MDKSSGSEMTDKERAEWVDTFAEMNQLRVSEKNTLRHKMAEKIKENPFVPIGLVTTTAALTYGIYSMRTGNKRRSQMMMRTRVISQGLTIAALLIGIAIASAKKSA